MHANALCRRVLTITRVAQMRIVCPRLDASGGELFVMSQRVQACNRLTSTLLLPPLQTEALNNSHYRRPQGPFPKDIPLPLTAIQGHGVLVHVCACARPLRVCVGSPSGIPSPNVDDSFMWFGTSTHNQSVCWETQTAASFLAL